MSVNPFILLNNDCLTSFSLTDLRLKASHNLQIQLLMKQGQVEIEPRPHVRTYGNCLLLHRGVVESFNKIIQVNK